VGDSCFLCNFLSKYACINPTYKQDEVRVTEVWSFCVQGTLWNLLSKLLKGKPCMQFGFCFIAHFNVAALFVCKRCMSKYLVQLRLWYVNSIAHSSILVVRQINNDAAQRVPLCRRMWLLSQKAEAQTRPHSLLYRRMPGSLPPWGRWVALLVSAHRLCLCHMNMLLFKCCQPFVANYTPFFSVHGQFLKSVERDPAFT